MSKVGYKRPPANTRFKKGKSGNPTGRPKGSKNIRNIVREILDEQVSIQENGVTRKVTKREALIRKVINGGFNLHAAALGHSWRIATEVDDEDAARQKEQTQKALTEADEEILERFFSISPEDRK